MILDRATLRRHLTVRGPRPTADVWDSYMRPQRWPHWSPQIRSVDYPTETLQPGGVGVVHGPAGVRARFRVIAIDAGGPVRSWTWSVGVGGLRFVLRHTVEGVSGGTVAGLTVEGFAPAVLGYLPIAWLALRRLVG
jgi:hypothetical protein